MVVLTVRRQYFSEGGGRLGGGCRGSCLMYIYPQWYLLLYLAGPSPSACPQSRVYNRALQNDKLLISLFPIGGARVQFKEFSCQGADFIVQSTFMLNLCPTCILKFSNAYREPSMYIPYCRKHKPLLSRLPTRGRHN